MSSSFAVSASVATNDANKNVAENVPRLIWKRFIRSFPGPFAAIAILPHDYGGTQQESAYGGMGGDAGMMRLIRTATLIAVAFFIALLIIYRFDWRMAITVFGIAIGMAVMAPLLGG
jgi:hypothetical protein